MMKNLISALFLWLIFSQCQPSVASRSDNSTSQQNAAQSAPNTNIATTTDAQIDPNAQPSIGVIASKPASTTNNQSTSKSEIKNQKSKIYPHSVSEGNSEDEKEEIVDVPTDAALLYKGLTPKSQYFDINTAEIDVKRLDCRGGTVILVNPKSFEFEDGTPFSGEFTLKVTEYLKKSDMILSPLTTMTRDNRPLESAGMIHAYAYAKGKLLRLKKGEEMHIGFRVTDDERFELFDGAAQAGTNLIDWTLAPKPKANNQIVHTKVDKRAKFGRGSELEYWQTHLMRPRALQKYKGECFSIAAFATVDKLGKLDKIRMVEQKELFMDIGADTTFLGVIKRMPNWVPAFKNGKPVTSRTLISINYCGAEEEENQIQVIKPEAYAASMKLMLDKMLETSEDNVLYFASKSLGWINCDRFYNDTRPKTQLLVDAGGQSADVKLIFKKMNAIMGMGRTKERTYKSPDVPIGELVSVVGFKKEGNQMYFAMQDATVGDKTVALNFAPISESALKDKIKTLNGID